jgi:hypothetical protein
VAEAQNEGHVWLGILQEDASVPREGSVRYDAQGRGANAWNDHIGYWVCQYDQQNNMQEWIERGLQTWP